MSTLGVPQMKPFIDTNLSKISVGTKLGAHHDTMVSLKINGTHTTKGVFTPSIHRPLLQLDTYNIGGMNIQTTRNDTKNLINIQDKSITQIGREKHQKYEGKHPINKAIMSKQVIDGNERQHMNVTINTVKSSK